MLYGLSQTLKSKFRRQDIGHRGGATKILTGGATKIFGGSLTKLFGGGTLLLPLALAALQGCAQPKYVKEEGAAQAAGQAQEKTAAADCTTQFKTSQLCVGWSWIVNPEGRNKGKALFKIFRENKYDKSPVPVSLDEVPTVIVDMPSMGHPSRPTNVTQVDIGTYFVENIVFTMTGEWEFKLQEKSGGVILDEAIVPLIR